MKLRIILLFEFENWAVIALGGIPNKMQVGDMGLDVRIYPVSSAATPHKKQEGKLPLKERWYPIQVKQEDKVGRPDIDSFEAMMMREDCEKGFFVSFDYSDDALREIESFFKRNHKVIVALTVRWRLGLRAPPARFKGHASHFNPCHHPAGHIGG
jgi:hypothetical protein